MIIFDVQSTLQSFVFHEIPAVICVHAVARKNWEQSGAPLYDTWPRACAQELCASISASLQYVHRITSASLVFIY